ncbi:FHA domain-containing protein [Leucobacter sp. UCMA 4100]|uniref:FHA domain-containing protein n=1 Tax=Leucobacter sp. UCMA 4100 TaxID=2810534 RepID=UPI0022EB34F0|nr:FHA domain-containing protein [Leucobacter sp. UCMA 4100]MDA3145761.1 FHA domain-containing protein [Leucobacter sp. UCMA 4100]
MARKPARPVLYLEGPDGQMLAHIASDALVGRSPRPTEQRVAVQLESPGRELSREHLTIDLDAEHQIIVTDQGASNGVGITLPGETVVHWLTAFTPTIVPPGSVLTMGDVLAQIRF